MAKSKGGFSGGLVGRNPASNFKESKKINQLPTYIFTYHTSAFTVTRQLKTSSLSGSVGVNNDSNIMLQEYLL